MSKKRKLGPKDDCKIKELVSLPIAPGLLAGQISHATRLYDQEDRQRIRQLIESIVGSNLKIFSFEDKNLIGRCSGHPWGFLAAARVINLTAEKECIIITIYDDEECSSTFAIKTLMHRANWKAVKRFDL